MRGETIYEPKPGEVEGGEGTKVYATHQARLVVFLFCLRPILTFSPYSAAEEIAQPLDAWCAFDYIDPVDKPQMLFEWKYRSRGSFFSSLSSSPRH